MQAKNELKQNVSVFNENVRENGGFLYTTNASFSSYVANKRISEAIFRHIQPEYRTLVDIGCGDGVYTNEIKQNFPQLHVEGFDPAAKAVERASVNFPNVKFSARSILDVNQALPGKKFDVAVIRGVLHHLSDQQKAIQNAFELADNIIIMEPNGNNPILKVIEKTSKYHIEHEEQSFLSGTLTRWIRQAGGHVTAFDYVGFVPFFFPTTPAKIIHFFQPFMEKVPGIKHVFSAQFIIAARKSS
ncbi:MAG: class I SAM-dependent methyltransferase [Cytophagaceae bacterium]|nr:class I SAM-dependent methyltransferase [Cytophagaceae bacterium]